MKHEAVTEVERLLVIVKSNIQDLDKAMERVLEERLEGAEVLLEQVFDPRKSRTDAEFKVQERHTRMRRLLSSKKKQ